MNGSFSVHPGSLRQGGESFALAADRLDEAVHRLRRALASSGEPWGHDRPGDQWRNQNHQPANVRGRSPNAMR